MKTRYRVKMLNDFTEPYMMSSADGSGIVRHISADEYIAYDKATFERALDDILDAPKKMLTDKDIRADFDTNREVKMAQSKVDGIKAYYNGRLALKKKIESDLKTVLNKRKSGVSQALRYAIPFEMNYFSCDENDPYDALVSSNEAYIEIEVAAED